MSRTKKMVVASLMIALGLVLPLAFHAIPQAGGVLLPMHIPILLCGLLCGLPYGMLCGIVTPLLSGLLTGMPPAAILPSMVAELAVYGLVSSILMHLLRSKRLHVRVYVSLLGAMLAGRFASGILNACLFRVGAYSLQVWLSAAFLTSLPGILIQVVLLPLVVLALQRAKLISFDA